MGLPTLRRSIRGVLRSRLTAPPRLSVAEWADRYRFISREHAAEPGRWNTDRAPYQRGIMDACSDPLIPDVVIMSSAQIGKTEVINNVIAYYADQDPAPILVIQPTLDMAEAWSKDRLAPMIRDTPRIREKFPPAKSRTPDNAILHKVFPGGHITVVGANAPSGLAARPIRILLCDEVDRYPSSAGTEGDPVSLGSKRQMTFWNRKKVRTSTPTIEGLSPIATAYEQSDQRKFWVPCPGCAAFQVLRWKNVAWENNDPRTAHYVCAHCGIVLAEEAKTQMLAAGEWRPEQEFRGVAGFWLNALYSPWARWTDLVDEWLRVQGNPEQLRVFVNTVLGETWREQGESVEPDPLMARREDYDTCPAGVGVVTMGVDVQADRLEVLIVGWGMAEESWRLGYETLRGDTTRADVWNDLDRVLATKYGGLPVAAACLDSGFHTDEVYRFVAPRQGRRVYAVKGMAGPGKALVGRPSKTNRAGVRLFPVGVDTAKDTLFARLKITAPGPGYLHFATWLDAEYFAQLTAEQVVVRHVKGRALRAYTKKQGRRNEALDLEVYAFAALATLGETTRRSLGTLAARRQPDRTPPPPNDAETPAIERVRRILRPKPRGGFATNF